MTVLEAIHAFLKKVSEQNIEIYNEFSFQHELGIFLRQSILNTKIQFERNVCYFGFDKVNFEKKEIDIAIFNDEQSELNSVLELKFPRNGQVPETMFSFCKDITFLEQLVNSGFKHGYFIALVDDELFYSGDKFDGIYDLFRNKQPITGEITKPTGKKDQVLQIKGKYTAHWLSVTEKMKCCIIEINA